MAKEWLNTHEFSKNEVILQRFHAGAWENLVTEQIDENASHYKYSTQTPGFSTFTITAAKTEAEEGPTEEGGEGLPWALIGGIIVAVAAISAFTLYRRK